MAPKQKKTTLYDLSRQVPSKTEIDANWNEMVHGSDRASALVASSLVEDALGRLLYRSMPHLSKTDINRMFFETNAPFWNFSSKIEIAYGMQLIKKTDHTELGCIRRVRNAFAHTIKPITFEHALINAECIKLPDREHSDDDIKNLCKAKQLFLCNSLYFAVRFFKESRKASLASSQDSVSTGE